MTELICNLCLQIKLCRLRKIYHR